jgi:hypothetical protein
MRNKKMKNIHVKYPKEGSVFLENNINCIVFKINLNTNKYDAFDIDGHQIFITERRIPFSLSLESLNLFKDVELTEDQLKMAKIINDDIIEIYYDSNSFDYKLLKLLGKI